jgi:hypothetical protein
MKYVSLVPVPAVTVKACTPDETVDGTWTLTCVGLMESIGRLTANRYGCSA